MLQIISRIIGGIFLNFVGMILTADILGKNKKILQKYESIIYILLMGVITTYIHLFSQGIIRAGLNILVIVIGIKLIFREENYKCIVVSLILMGLTIISEVIVVIILTLVFKLDLNILNELIFGKLIANSLISIILTIIYIVSKETIYIIVNKNKIVSIPILLLIFLCFIICIIYAFQNIKENVNFSTLIFNVLSIVMMLSLIYIIFIERIKNKIANEQKELLNKSILIYEKAVEKLRISQHENKNELSIIRNMVLTKNLKLKQYLNSIITEKKKDQNIEVMLKLKNLHSSIIKSLLYEKANEIYSKKINLIINVNIKRESYINNLNINEEKDLCKILGVLIDNAVQCVEKNIHFKMGIFISSDFNCLVFDIFNNYKSISFLENRRKKPIIFSGKNNRGLGLKLANKLVKKYQGLELKTEIDNEYINQKVIYKNIKKK